MTKLDEIVQNICDKHAKCCEQIQKIIKIEKEILNGTHIPPGWENKRHSRR